MGVQNERIADGIVMENLSTKSIHKSLKAELDFIENDRENTRHMLLDYFEHSGTDEHIRRFFRAGISTEVPIFTSNLLGRFVRARSLVYKKSPEMIVDDKYIDNIDIQNLNTMRRRMEQLTFLLGSMAQLSYYDELSQQVKYETIHDFKVFFLPGKTEPFACCYPVSLRGNARMNEQKWIFWSADAIDPSTGEFTRGQHFLFDNNGNIFSINEDNINPYGVLPILFTHRSPQTRTWWVEGATDLMVSNQQVDLGLTQLALANRIDALGIKYISGPWNEQTKRERLPHGVQDVIRLPEGFTFGRVEGGDTAKHINNLKFFVNQAAQNNHLQLKWASEGGDIPSGRALQLMEVENTEQREAGIQDIWRPHEQSRYTLDKIILETHGKVSIGDDYSVNFVEPDLTITSEDERAQEQHDLELGLTSRKRLLEKRNPDITEEELDDIIAEADAEQTSKQTTPILPLI